MRRSPDPTSTTRAKTPARWPRRTPPSATPTKARRTLLRTPRWVAAAIGRRSPKSCRRTSSASTGTSHGDVDAALAASAVTVSGTFTTDWVYQATSSRTARPHGWRAAAKLVVAGGMQGIFYTRSQLAKIFGLPISKVPRGGHAARRRVRVQDHGHGAARRGRSPEAPPARPPRAHAARGHDDARTRPRPRDRARIGATGTAA